MSTVVIPALAMLMVCCSMASWIATRSSSRILSNSSMHTHPPSAKTIAPPSRRNSPSPPRMTEAVRPAADEPFPLVYTQIGAVFSTNFRNCDLAVDGSPINNTLTSPRKRAPSGVVFRDPEKRSVATAALMSSLPKMAGAIRPRMSPITSLNGLEANRLNSACSASEKCGSPRAPSDSSNKPTTFKYGCDTADPPPPPPRVLSPPPPPPPTVYTPKTLTRVPGTIFCTKLRVTHSVTFRGISPAGTSSGFSCILRVCMSANLDFSGITRYGSRPHPPSAEASGFAAAWSQTLGTTVPPNPAPIARYLTLRHVLH